jgi:hypothetical protein
VLPILLIALLALLAMIIFVKKEKDLKYKAVDIVSIIFNFIIPFVYLPFVTVLSIFIDIEGGGPELYFQILYFIPWVSTLCLAASVALRRKGYAVRALITEFAGPAVFALYLVVFYFGELFS